MPLFITHASYSTAGIKGLILTPEDRATALQKIAEKAGGKVVALYMTTGDSDTILITDFDDPEQAVAMNMAIAATGSVSRQKTERAWTSADFVRVAQKAAELSDTYTPPGVFREGYI